MFSLTKSMNRLKEERPIDLRRSWAFEMKLSISDSYWARKG